MSAPPAVLLVDDEAHILSSLRRSLRREGWVLETAEGAAAGLAKLSERPFALVVSDQKMPGMSGMAFLEEVGRRYPGVRRVLLSGWPEMIPRAELDALGIDRLLPKPWEDEELKATLRGLVGAER